MGIQLFVIVAAVTAILAEDLKCRDQLPLGVIWIVSTLIYGGMGIVLGFRALWQQQPSPNPMALAAGQLSLNVFVLAIVGFAAGYYVTKRIVAIVRAGEMRIAVLIRQASAFSYYTLLVQLLVACYFLVSILFDLPDRYNSYPGSTFLGKFLSSISLATLLGPAAFFCLGWQARRCTSWPKSGIAVFTGSTAVLNLMLVMKTGSRSILLGLLLAFLIGWLTHSASWRAFVHAVAAVALLLLIFVPFSEALRIARSDSDFYRVNPAHAVVLLKASLLRQPEPNVILKQLERHPLDRSIYEIVSDCQYRLSRTTRGAAPTLQSAQLRLLNCDADRRGHIATDYWPSVNNILAGLVRADSSLLFPSQSYLHSLEIYLYGATGLSSKGEAPSLRADVYYRFGFVGVFLVYLSLGFLHATYNSTCFYVLRHRSVYVQLSVALLPLALMTGNLSLGLLTQLWLLFIQLPKNICIIIVVSYIISLIAKRLMSLTQSFDS